jgi:hypothetical protein
MKGHIQQRGKNSWRRHSGKIEICSASEEHK